VAGKAGDIVDTLIDIVKRGPYPKVACPCLGFVGETCSKCGATHNIEIWGGGFAIGPGGFMCERCGHYNIMSFHPSGLLHRKPDFGWKRSVIGWAIRAFGWYRDYLKKTEEMLESMKK